MSDSWIIYAKIRQQELDRELEGIARRQEIRRALKKLKKEERNRRPRFHILLCILGRNLAALGLKLVNKYGCQDNGLNPVDQVFRPGIRPSISG